MHVTIRTAHDGEAGELARLHLRTVLHAYAHIFPAEAEKPGLEENLPRWKGWIDSMHHDTASRVFVADAGPRAVGVVVVGRDPDEPHFGHLSRLHVEPEHWGARIGTALYRAAVSHLTSCGFVTATLWVLEHNARAREWYERLGWRTTGERIPTYAPAGIDDLRYRLELTPPR